MAATQGAAISIDHAASGLLRHRFVRAISASALVFVVGVLIAFVVTAMFSDSGYAERGDQIGFAFIMVFVGLGLLFAFAVFVSVAGALFDFLHRRLVAFVLLCANLVVLVFGLFIVVAGAGLESGLIARTDPSTGDMPLWQVWSLIGVMLLSALIAFEGVGWAWWQLWISRAGFFAARGWKPPPWRVFSGMRQRLGLPAFISNFGRGRLGLTLIYFLVAVLNMGLVAILAIPVFVFAIEQDAANSTIFLFVALGFAGLVVLNAIGVSALLQKVAAARATKLYQDARDWDTRAPIVFLRAFDQDQTKLKALSRDPLVKIPAGCGESRTLDELLLEQASVYGPVIAIGDPRDPTPPLGAARVFVQGPGDEWQGVVTSLVGASNAVVMCPSTSEGVQWELDLIAGAMGRVRVIFLANPELSREATLALFDRLAPQGAAPVFRERQIPIAAWMDGQRRWRVLTTSKPACVQTYTVALAYALQAVLGMKGVALAKVRKR